MEQMDKLENGLMKPDYKRGGEIEYKYIKAANKQLNFQVNFCNIFDFNCKYFYLNFYI